MNKFGLFPLTSKNLTTILTSVLLAACGSGTDQSAPSEAQSQIESRKLTGVVTKGPVTGGSVELFIIEPDGTPSSFNDSFEDADGDGVFVIDSPIGGGFSLAIARGGSFFDESDVTGQRQITLGSTDELFAVIPPDATQFAVTPLSHALYIKTLKDLNILGPDTDFETEFTANRALAQQAYGFDVVTTLPADPVAAGSGSREFAQVLGGMANAINEIAIGSGLPFMDFPSILAFIDDVSDGIVDGRRFGITINAANGNPIPIVDLNSAINRFRNNHSQLYNGTEFDGVGFESLAAPSNDSPTAVADSFDLGAVSSANLNVLNNDSDPNGDPIRIISVGASALGAEIVIDTNSETGFTQLSYIPGDSGTDRFDYSITDGRGLTANATVTVTVVRVAGTPIAADDSAETNEDESVTIDVFANDEPIDGEIDPGSISIVSSPSNGAAQPITGGVIYTPNENFNGSDSFSYQFENSAGGVSNTATVTIEVIAVNDAPVANPDAFSVNQGEELIVVAPGVLANDEDPDADEFLTALLVGPAPANAEQFGLNLDGSFLYRSNSTFTGTDVFSYQVSDNTTTSNTVQVAIIVQAVNQPPVANDDSAVTDQNVTVQIPVFDNDVDPDDSINTETFNIVGLPSNGNVAVDSATGEPRYTPDLDFTGVDSFIYNVADFAGDRSNNATVTVTVNAVNTAPNISIDPTFNATQAQRSTITTSDLNAFDQEDDSTQLVFTIIEGPSNGRILLDLIAASSFTLEDIQNGTVDYQHYGGNNLTDSVVLRLTDSGGLTDQDTFEIDINSDDISRNFNGIATAIGFEGRNFDPANSQPNLFGQMEFSTEQSDLSLNYSGNGADLIANIGPIQQEADSAFETSNNSGYTFSFNLGSDLGADTLNAGIDAGGLIAGFFPFEERIFSNPSFGGQRDEASTFRLIPFAGGYGFTGAAFSESEFDISLIDSSDVGTAGDVHDATDLETSTEISAYLGIHLEESTGFNVARTAGQYGQVRLFFTTGNLLNPNLGQFLFAVSNDLFNVDQQGNGTRDNAQSQSTSLSRSPGNGSPAFNLSNGTPAGGVTFDSTFGSDGSGQSQLAVNGSPVALFDISSSPDGSVIVGESSSGTSGTESSHRLIARVRLGGDVSVPVGRSYLVNQINFEILSSGSTGLLVQQAARLTFVSSTEVEFQAIAGGNTHQGDRAQDNAAPAVDTDVDGELDQGTGALSFADDGSFVLTFTDGTPGDPNAPVSTVTGYLSDDGETLIARTVDDQGQDGAGVGLLIGGLDHNYTANQNPPAITISNLEPITLQGGENLQLNATAQAGAGGDPQALSIRWSSTAGTFNDPNIANPIFTAKDFNGAALITAIVSDGIFERTDSIRIDVTGNVLPQGTINRQARTQGDISDHFLQPSEIQERFVSLNPVSVFDGTFPQCSGGSRTLDQGDNDGSQSLTVGDTPSVLLSDCQIFDQGFPNNPLSGSISFEVTQMQGMDMVWTTTFAYSEAESPDEIEVVSGGVTVSLNRVVQQGGDNFYEYTITGNPNANNGTYSVTGNDFSYTLLVGFQFNYFQDFNTNTYQLTPSYQFSDLVIDSNLVQRNYRGIVDLEQVAPSPLSGTFSGSIGFSGILIDDPTSGAFSISYSQDPDDGPHDIFVSISGSLVNVFVDENQNGVLDYAFETTTQDIDESELFVGRLNAHAGEIGILFEGQVNQSTNGSPTTIFKLFANSNDFINNGDGSGEVFCCLGNEFQLGQATNNGTSYFNFGFFDLETQIEGPFVSRVDQQGQFALPIGISEEVNPGDTLFPSEVELEEGLRLLPAASHGVRIGSNRFRSEIYELLDFDNDGSGDAIDADAQIRFDAEVGLVVTADKTSSAQVSTFAGRYGYVGLFNQFEENGQGDSFLRGALFEVSYDQNGFGTEELFSEVNVTRRPGQTPLLTAGSPQPESSGEIVQRLRVFADGEIEFEEFDSGTVVNRSSGFGSADGQLLQESSSGQGFVSYFVGVRRPSGSAALAGRTYRLNSVTLNYSESGASDLRRLNELSLEFDGTGENVTITGVEVRNFSTFSRDNDTAETEENSGLNPGTAITPINAAVTLGSDGFFSIDLSGSETLDGYQSESGEILVLRSTLSVPNLLSGHGIGVAVLDTGFDLDNVEPTVTITQPSGRTLVLNGGTLQLQASANDSDGPLPLSFQWSSTAGNFDDASAPNPTWTAPAEGFGAVLLHVVVDDGETPVRDSVIIDLALP